jgi:hypothetical protein
VLHPIYQNGDEERDKDDSRQKNRGKNSGAPQAHQKDGVGDGIGKIFQPDKIGWRWIEITKIREANIENLEEWVKLVAEKENEGGDEIKPVDAVFQLAPALAADSVYAGRKGCTRHHPPHQISGK